MEGADEAVAVDSEALRLDDELLLVLLDEADRFSQLLCSGAQVDQIMLNSRWNWRMFGSWRSSDRWLGGTTRRVRTFVRANPWGRLDGSVFGNNWNRCWCR